MKIIKIAQVPQATEGMRADMQALRQDVQDTLKNSPLFKHLRQKSGPNFTDEKILEYVSYIKRQYQGKSDEQIVQELQAKSQQQPQQGQPQQGQPQQGQPQDAQPYEAGEQFQGAMDPRIKKVFMQSLMGTGLSKQKVLPFLEQLFTGLGDIPISKVTGLLKALQQDPEVS